MIFLDDSSPNRDAVASQVISTYIRQIGRSKSPACFLHCDLEDLASAIALRYVSRKHLYRACRGSFSGFVWTLCKSELISQHRRQTAALRDRRRTISLDDDDDLLASLGSTCFQPTTDRRLDIEAALRQLDEGEVQLVSLLLNGYTVTEAAAKLGVGRSTAYRRLGQIRHVLRSRGFGDL